MPGINLRARGLLAQGGGFGDLGDEVSAGLGLTILSISAEQTVYRYLNFTAPSGTRWAIAEIGCRYASSNNPTSMNVARVPSGVSPASGQLVGAADLSLPSSTNQTANLFLSLDQGDAGLGETPGHNIVEAGESLYLAVTAPIANATINDFAVWVRLFKLPARVGTANV